MTQTVQASRVDQREVKAAAEVKAGDMVIDLLMEGQVAEVLFTQPYVDVDLPMTMLVIELVGDNPETLRLRPDALIAVATDQEIAVAKAEVRRSELCRRLRAVAGLIERKQLPLPGKYGAVELDFRFTRDEADLVDQVAEQLGATATTQYGQRHVEQDNEALGVRWCAPYTEPAAADPDPTGLGYSREQDNGDPAAPVPVGVDGTTLTGRPVSAAPVTAEVTW